MLGNWATGSARERHEAAEHRHDGDDDGDDRAADEEGGHVSGLRARRRRPQTAWSTTLVPGAGWPESTMTRSPGESPSLTTQRVSTRGSGLDGFDLDRVVGGDDADLRRSLELADGALRDEKRVAQGLRLRAHPAVLPRPKQLIRVGKRGADANGAGLGIDLAIGGQEVAGGRIDRAVGEGQLQAAASLPEIFGSGDHVDLFGDLQILLLAQREVGADGIDLRHRREQGRQVRQDLRSAQWRCRRRRRGATAPS